MVMNWMIIHFFKASIPQRSRYSIILFFKSSWWKIASAARNWINSVPQIAPMTFVLSSIFILLLWTKYTFLYRQIYQGDLFGLCIFVGLELLTFSSSSSSSSPPAFHFFLSVVTTKSEQDLRLFNNSSFTDYALCFVLLYSNCFSFAVLQSWPLLFDVAGFPSSSRFSKW